MTEEELNNKKGKNQRMLPWATPSNRANELERVTYIMVVKGNKTNRRSPPVELVATSPFATTKQPARRYSWADFV